MALSLVREKGRATADREVFVLKIISVLNSSIKNISFPDGSAL